MKIGIDLDGVVIDSENNFRTYEEIFAIEDLNERRIINYQEPKYQGRYLWTEEEQKMFNEKYLLKAASESNLMPGFLIIYEKLKKMGFEMIVITARGGLINEMKNDAIQLLEKNKIFFDKYYWNITNKLEICQKEKIDIMIDDDYKIVKQISNSKIKTIYFRAGRLKKLKTNKFIYEVNNWGDIYRYFVNLKKDG